MILYARRYPPGRRLLHDNDHCPDASTRPGRFGPYGGRFVPETLMFALDQLAAAYDEAKHDPAFQSRVPRAPARLRRPAVAAVLRRAADAGGRRGPHLPQARGPQPHRGAQDQQRIGQALLAEADGQDAHHRRDRGRAARRRHAPPPPPCSACRAEVYMGAEDVRRQELNVFQMRAMGTEVFPVESGSRTLRDAINEAMRDWMATVEHTHYIIGSVVGPHPFPVMVRDFQSVIGDETKRAVPGAGRPAAGRGGRVRRRREQRGRHVLPVRRRRRRRAGRRRGRRPRARRRATTRRRSATASRACCTAASATSCRTTTARRRRAFRLGRAGLPRRRPGAQLLEGRRPRALHAASATTRRSTASASAAGWRASCRRWRRRTRSSRRCARRPGASQGRRRRRVLLRPRRQGLRRGGAAGGAN